MQRSTCLWAHCLWMGAAYGTAQEQLPVRIHRWVPQRQWDGGKNKKENAHTKFLKLRLCWRRWLSLSRQAFLTVQQAFISTFSLVCMNLVDRLHFYTVATHGHNMEWVQHSGSRDCPSDTACFTDPEQGCKQTRCLLAFPTLTKLWKTLPTFLTILWNEIYPW